MPTVDPSGPPPDLTKDFKALYRKVREEMRNQGTFEDTDRILLGMFVRCLERAAVARSGLGDGPVTVIGSKGTAVPHPLVRIARDAERDAAEYGKELLLSPRSRKQYEIEARKAGGRFGSKFGLD